MIRHFQRILFLFLVSLVTSTTLLADLAPELEADTSGYVNDAVLEHAPDMPAVKKKVVKKAVVKADVDETPAYVPTAKAPVFKKKESGNTMMFIIIGVVVLLIVIGGVAFVFIKKKKASPSVDETEVTNIPQAPLPPQAASKSAPKPTAPKGPAVDPLQTRVYAPPKMSDDIAAATRIDERGCNPSGLIIDEDKYFESGGEDFVDEDFG